MGFLEIKFKEPEEASVAKKFKCRECEFWGQILHRPYGECVAFDKSSYAGMGMAGEATAADMTPPCPVALGKEGRVREEVLTKLSLDE